MLRKCVPTVAGIWEEILLANKSEKSVTFNLVLRITLCVIFLFMVHYEKINA